MLGRVPSNTPVDLFCLYPAFCYCTKMAAGTPSAALKGEDGLDVREGSAGCRPWTEQLKCDTLTAEWEERETCLCREPNRRTRARATNSAEAYHSTVCGGETLIRETTRRTRARFASPCSAQHLVLKTAFVINKGEVPREFG
jgi:hypothetical protein